MKEREINPGDRVRHLESGHVGTVDAVIRHQQGVAVRIDWDSGESGGYVPRVLIPASLPIPDGFAVAEGDRRPVYEHEDVWFLCGDRACHSPLGDSTPREVWILRRVEPADPLADLRIPRGGAHATLISAVRLNELLDEAHVRGKRDERERVLEQLEQCTCSGDAPFVRRSDVIQAIRELRKEGRGDG